jgi:competence protein ComEC
MHFKTIIFVAGIATGIIVGETINFGSEIAIASLILAVMQVGIYVVGRKRNAEGLALSLFVFLFSLGTFIGIFRVQFEREKEIFVCNTVCTFEAEIISSPETKDAYQTLVVHPVESGDDMYDVQLRVPLYPKFAIGDTINVSGKVSVPQIIYPHEGEQSFDYAAYLHTKQIGSESLFPKIELVDSEAHTVTQLLGRWKEDMVARTNNYVSAPASSLASGMLFGSSDMPKELSDTFRAAGLSHIIVLSGFNIAVVISFVLFVLAFVPLVVRIAIASVSVIAFVMMVGAEASVVRASLMAFVALLSTLMGRAYVARQALMLSLLAIILYEPQSLLHDVSLHLSFLATTGIVYLSDPIKDIVSRYLSKQSFVELVTTTLAAYFATLPYVCYTFGSVSPYALVANILALPLVPLAMLFSFSAVLFSYLSDAVARIFGFADTMLIDIILFFARSIEHLPFSRFAVSINAYEMIFLYASFLVLVYFIQRKTNNETYQTTKEGYLTDTISY